MWHDDSSLLDILQSCRQLVGCTSDLTEDEFLKSVLLQLACTRLFEIIGEAARRISDDFQSQHPDIPWFKMRGLRNRIIHEYDKVDFHRLWQIIQEDIPALIVQIEPLVPPEQ